MSEQRKMYADLKDELLITRDQIAVRVKEMGAEITRDFEGKDLTVICILKGAVVFFVDLIREIDLPMTMDFMAISSYGSATKSSGVVRILKDLDKPINGKDVLKALWSGAVSQNPFLSFKFKGANKGDKIVVKWSGNPPAKPVR